VDAADGGVAGGFGGGFRWGFWWQWEGRVQHITLAFNEAVQKEL